VNTKSIKYIKIQASSS